MLDRRPQGWLQLVRCPSRFPRARALALQAFVLLQLALAGSLGAQRLPLTVYTAQDGLAGSQVWDVLVDRRGLLWVASTWGFSRFDGERFTTLSVQDGLPSPNARTLLEDLDGALWLGTGDGVARFDGFVVQAFGGVADAPRGTVWASARDRAGRLWFATERGLVRYANGAFRRFGKADGLADDYVYALFVASDGALWVGSRGEGVARCELDPRGDLGGCRRLGVEDGLGSGVVRAFAEDRAGRILIGTRGGGLSLFENGALRARPMRVADGLTSDDVYTVLVRANGLVVVGGSQGLAICLAVEPGRCRGVSEENGLPSHEIRALFEDGEGTLWIGTESGLAQLVRDDFWSFTHADGLPDDNVYALAADRDDGLWVGTVGGLARLTLGRHGEPTVVRHPERGALPAPWVWAVHVDRRGGVWAGTEKGACRLRAGVCELFTVDDGLPSSYVLSFAEDDDALWIGTTAGVARLRFDPRGGVRTIDAFGRAQGLAGDRVYALALDAEGRVWAAHAEALSLFDPRSGVEGFRAVQVGEGFGARSLRGLGLDSQGRVLIGAFGQVARHEGDLRFRRWTRGAGLGEEMVLTLSEGDAGRFVLGTSLGVVVFDPEAGGGQGAVVARWNAGSGTVATEVSHSGAFAREAGGSTWFGFKGGLTRLPSRPMPASLAPPAVEFSRLASERGRTFLAPFLALDRGPSGWLGAARPSFPHHDVNLRAEVRALSFRQRAGVRFQFRLEGEEEWSEPRGEPFRDLQKLAPGAHRLLARAARPGGEWSQPAAVAFDIEYAWWRTPSFLAGLAAAGLAVVAFGVSQRGRRTAKLASELERRIAERTDDLARYAVALGEHLQAVDRASDRARRAESARRELFARTSHELRTPLTAILGFSELLERALADRLDERERKYLANVHESGELLLRQINNLLDQLKLEAGRMELHLEEISVGGLVESVASLMEGYALHRGVRLELDTASAPPPVKADLAKLRQVLMNLISNAIKFSPADETVAIAVRALDETASPWPGTAYEITIRDRGPGIPPDALEAIFEPYRQLGGTVAAASPGTGLGLPISRQFVELLGGRIEVESRPGEGAEFRIVLPADPSPGELDADVADSGSFDSPRSQLLILDRDRDRFARLSRAAGGAGLLALRGDDVESLRRMLVTLRPRAGVIVVEPLQAASWREAEAAIRALAEQSTPFVVLSVVAERALALAFGGVLAADAGEAAVRRVLRALGTAPRTTGRRPLGLVAADRDAGVRFGVALAAAGCDHFRVEGDEARSALADVTPDLVAGDWRHAFDLAAELALAGAGGSRGLVLIDAGSVGAAEVARLAERTAELGEPVEAALVAGATRLLGAAAAGDAPP